MKLAFDTVKSSAWLVNAAKDPCTHYNSPVYRTHPYGYNFFVQFYPYGLDAAAGNHASILFALFHGDYNGFLTWPFPKTIHLSVRDQVDPQSTWTITFAPSEKISFRRPTREPLPTLMNFIFFPHSKMFSKTEKLLFNDTSSLEMKYKYNKIKENTIHRPTPPWRRHTFHTPTIPLIEPCNQFFILLTPVSCRVLTNA